MVLCREQARHKSVSTHFSSPDPKGHLRYCHHCLSLSFLSSSVYLYILIFLSKTTGPIGHKLCRNVHYTYSCTKFMLWSFWTGNPPQKQKATRCQNGCFLFLYVVHLCLTNYDYFHDVPYRILYVVCQRFVWLTILGMCHEREKMNQCPKYICLIYYVWVRFIVFNATFNIISVIS